LEGELARQGDVVVLEWDPIAGVSGPSECFPLCRAWYVYWEGDLKRFAKGVDPIESYVSI
jgi:hypothetical protein